MNGDFLPLYLLTTSCCRRSVPMLVFCPHTVLTFEPRNPIILDYQATLAEYINNGEAFQSRRKPTSRVFCAYSDWARSRRIPPYYNRGNLVVYVTSLPPAHDASSPHYCQRCRSLAFGVNEDRALQASQEEEEEDGAESSTEESSISSNDEDDEPGLRGFPYFVFEKVRWLGMHSGVFGVL